MSTVEEEVVAIEKELLPILSLAERIVKTPNIQAANLKKSADNFYETELFFPFTKKEKIKFLFPYIGVIALGDQPGTLEVTDLSGSTPRVILKREFYAEATGTTTVRMFSVLNLVDDVGFGSQIQAQRYRIRFTPDAGPSSGLHVTLRRFYRGGNDVFDVYGVVL